MGCQVLQFPLVNNTSLRQFTLVGRYVQLNNRDKTGKKQAQDMAFGGLKKFSGGWVVVVSRDVELDNIPIAFLVFFGSQIK